MNIKQYIKKYLNQAISLVGPHKWAHKEPTLLILMYHRVLPKSDPRYLTEQPGMLVTPESLELHLETLKQFFEPIHLHEWLRRKKNNLPLAERSVAITFDDGWADNYEHAFPLLKKYDMPATIFLVSNLIDTNKTFWPERLSSLINSIAQQDINLFKSSACAWLHQLEIKYQFTAPPTTDELDEIISKSKGYTDNEITALIDELMTQIKIKLEVDILTSKQIKEMKNSSLVEFGSHTKSHIRMLPELSQDVMNDEIIGSQTELSGLLNSNIDIFCYPNGNSTPTAEKTVSENYFAACTTSKGWVTKNTPFHKLPRIGIHDDISNTKSAFLARLSGWL